MCVVSDNIGLVGFVIRRYFKHMLTEYDYEDLVQIGTIGLIKASKLYDDKLGFTFSTLAVKYIWSEIIQFERNHNKFNLNRTEWYMYDKVRKSGLSEAEDIVNKTGLRLEDVNRVKSYASVSINAKNDCGYELETLLGSDEFEDRLLDNLQLQELLDLLPKQYRTVVKLYYFDNKSQYEIGHMLGVPQAKVSRMLIKALNQMRQGTDTIKRGKFTQIKQYTLAHELLNTFKSATEGAKITGVNRSVISGCVHGKLKTAGGYIWKGVE